MHDHQIAQRPPKGHLEWSLLFLSCWISLITDSTVPIKKNHFIFHISIFSFGFRVSLVFAPSYTATDAARKKDYRERGEYEKEEREKSKAEKGREKRAERGGREAITTFS